MSRGPPPGATLAPGQLAVGTWNPTARILSPAKQANASAGQIPPGVGLAQPWGPQLLLPHSPCPQAFPKPSNPEPSQRPAPKRQVFCTECHKDFPSSASGNSLQRAPFLWELALPSGLVMPAVGGCCCRFPQMHNPSLPGEEITKGPSLAWDDSAKSDGTQQGHWPCGPHTATKRDGRAGDWPHRTTATQTQRKCSSQGFLPGGLYGGSPRQP